jgi:hypothetical protein
LAPKAPKILKKVPVFDQKPLFPILFRILLIKKVKKHAPQAEKNFLTLFFVKNCGWVGLALDPPPHTSKILWVGGFFGWVGPGRLTPPPYVSRGLSPSCMTRPIGKASLRCNGTTY